MGKKKNHVESQPFYARWRTPSGIACIVLLHRLSSMRGPVEVGLKVSIFPLPAALFAHQYVTFRALLTSLKSSILSLDL